MNIVNVDRVPISHLYDRYGIKKTALRNRLKKAGIKPINEGRKSYVSAEQLRLLDELNANLKSSGVIKSINNDSVLFKPDFVQITQQILAETNNPFCDLEMLQTLCDRGWLIDTARLAKILRISPTTLIKHRKYYHCGFCCVKTSKQRGNSVWKVLKYGDDRD